jgi:hypothetical protein
VQGVEGPLAVDEVVGDDAVGVTRPPGSGHRPSERLGRSLRRTSPNSVR